MSTAAGGYVREPEDPGVLAANLRVGVRLLASAVAFVFVAFVFAFFYLRVLNSNGQWRPSRTHPSQSYGIAILVCVLAATVFFELARRGLGGAGRSGWRIHLWVAVALGVAVAVLQVLQYTSLGFGATGGGYASVFYGWTVLFLAAWLGAVYWIETLLAGLLRGATGPGHGDAEPLELLRPSAEACSTYLLLMSGIEIVAYVLLYLIK